MISHARLGAVSPGWGLGALRLGMVRDEVKAILGAPQTEAERDEDGDARLTYAGGIYLFFDHDEGGRLVHILLEEADALLVAGVRDGRLVEADLVSWLGASCFRVDDTDFLTPDGAPAFERARISSARGVTLYSDEAERLTGCGVYVVFDALDQIVWPVAGTGDGLRDKVSSGNS